VVWGTQSFASPARWLLAGVGVFGAVAVAVAAGPVPVAPPLDPAERLPGGAATSRASTTTADAFSAVSATVPFEQELDFKIGNGIFRKFWVSSPASTKTSDGLGPLYNARSCQGCHLKDGRGQPPNASGIADDSVTLLLRLSAPDGGPEPVYGRQLQPFAVQGHPAEGRIEVRYREVPVTLAGGVTASLRRPDYSVVAPAYGPLAPGTLISPRIAPPMIGLGLLEAVPKADILANADPSDANGDGISGRPNLVPSLRGGQPALGRFGWKAGAPTVEQQSAEAFANDIGISSALVPLPWGECTAAQTHCRQAPHGGPAAKPTVEIGDDLLKLVVFYAQNLAVPPRRDPDAPMVLAGREAFHGMGCASCHAPRFKTDADAGHLADQTIWPYTDLLLHDMGPGLADGRPEAEADGQEWRTPPLWGVGLTKTVSGHTYFLHDGRARSLEEAILWHGGEAKRARDSYAVASKEVRDALLAFLESL
jgi:CxxC motif-containing protein (DUF1111 family)